MTPPHSHSAYAPQLATQLNLSSVQLNTIGPAGNLGVYLSGVCGIGTSVDRRGPVPTLVFAAVCLFSGYTLLKLFYDGGEQGLFVTLGMPGLVLAQFLTGVGSTAGVASASNATAKSFDKSRGLTLSLILAGLGLSAFFYSTLGRLVLSGAEDFTSSFLLLLACGTCVSMILGVVFIRPVPPATKDDASFVEGAEAEETGQEPDERTPLTGKVAEVDEVNVTGWKLFREFDFWCLFLFNGLMSGTGLSKPIPFMDLLRQGLVLITVSSACAVCTPARRLCNRDAAYDTNTLPPALSTQTSTTSAPSPAPSPAPSVPHATSPSPRPRSSPSSPSQTAPAGSCPAARPIFSCTARPRASASRECTGSS